MRAWALEHQNNPVSGSGCGDKENDKKKLVMMMIRREKETTKKYTVCLYFFYFCFFSFCTCVCIIICRPLLLDASSLLIKKNVVLYTGLCCSIFLTFNSFCKLA